MEDFFEEIRLSLESGGEVKLSGFGNFELRNKVSVRGVIQKQVKAFLFLLAV